MILILFIYYSCLLLCNSLRAEQVEGDRDYSQTRQKVQHFFPSSTIENCKETRFTEPLLSEGDKQQDIVLDSDQIETYINSGSHVISSTRSDSTQQHSSSFTWESMVHNDGKDNAKSDQGELRKAGSMFKNYSSQNLSFSSFIRKSNSSLLQYHEQGKNNEELDDKNENSEHAYHEVIPSNSNNLRYRGNDDTKKLLAFKESKSTFVNGKEAKGSFSYVNVDSLHKNDSTLAKLVLGSEDGIKKGIASDHSVIVDTKEDSDTSFNSTRNSNKENYITEEEQKEDELNSDTASHFIAEEGSNAKIIKKEQGSQGGVKTVYTGLDEDEDDNQVTTIDSDDGDYNDFAKPDSLHETSTLALNPKKKSKVNREKLLNLANKKKKKKPQSHLKDKISDYLNNDDTKRDDEDEPKLKKLKKSKKVKSLEKYKETLTKIANLSQSKNENQNKVGISENKKIANKLKKLDGYSTKLNDPADEETSDADYEIKTKEIDVNQNSRYPHTIGNAPDVLETRDRQKYGNIHTSTYLYHGASTAAYDTSDQANISNEPKNDAEDTYFAFGQHLKLVKVERFKDGDDVEVEKRYYSGIGSNGETINFTRTLRKTTRTLIYNVPANVNYVFYSNQSRGGPIPIYQGPTTNYQNLQPTNQPYRVSYPSTNSRIVNYHTIPFDNSYRANNQENENNHREPSTYIRTRVGSPNYPGNKDQTENDALSQESYKREYVYIHPINQESLASDKYVYHPNQDANDDKTLPRQQPNFGRYAPDEHKASNTYFEECYQSRPCKNSLPTISNRGDSSNPKRFGNVHIAQQRQETKFGNKYDTSNHYEQQKQPKLKNIKRWIPLNDEGNDNFGDLERGLRVRRQGYDNENEYSVGYSEHRNRVNTNRNQNLNSDSEDWNDQSNYHQTGHTHDDSKTCNDHKTTRTSTYRTSGPDSDEYSTSNNYNPYSVVAGDNSYTEDWYSTTTDDNYWSQSTPFMNHKTSNRAKTNPTHRSTSHDHYGTHRQSSSVRNDQSTRKSSKATKATTPSSPTKQPRSIGTEITLEVLQRQLLYGASCGKLVEEGGVIVTNNPDSDDSNNFGRAYAIITPLTTTTEDSTRQNPRIVGGNEAVAGTWPWFVTLRYMNEHKCAGTIIGHKYVLTASHCFPSFSDIKNFTVIAGTHFKTGVLPMLDQERTIDKITLHPNFNKAAKFDNDIALIRLNKPFNFNQYVQAACLPDKNEKLPNSDSIEQCCVAGYGDTQSTGSDIALNELCMPILTTKQCNSSDYYNGRLTQTMLCAGYVEGGKDACKGDSGGPFMCDLRGTYKLVGIVSWGEGCARAKRPGLYTKVSLFHQWISKNL